MDQQTAQGRAIELGKLLLTQQRGYGFAFTGPDGVISDWTGAAEWITGWSTAEIVGLPIATMFTEQDRLLKLDQHELNLAWRLGSAEDERWHVRKDGSQFWASGICLPLAESRGFVKIFKDASHLRSRTQTLENQARELARQGSHREDILGVVAHELRNPMGPIKIASTLLRQRDSSPEVARLTKIIGRQLESMERIVEDLVDITRAHSGKLSMVYHQTELQAVLIEAFEVVLPTAHSKDIELTILVPPSPIEVEVDPGRIRQVVTNLLTNAVRFTDAGGHVSLSSTVDATHFFIQVRDDGIGIGPDLLPRIFDMFTQAVESSAGRGEGLGIGLAVVKEIVASHGGSIEVRSEGVRKGTEFTLRLPLTRQAKI